MPRFHSIHAEAIRYFKSEARQAFGFVCQQHKFREIAPRLRTYENYFQIQLSTPKIKMRVEGATGVGQWYKAVGDWIEKGEILCEIHSAKISLDLESPVSGTILQVVPEGLLLDAHAGIALVQPGTPTVTCVGNPHSVSTLRIKNKRLTAKRK